MKNKKTLEITHKNFKQTKGSYTIKSVSYLVKNWKTKKDIKHFNQIFKYNLDFTIDSIRLFYNFDVTC